MFIKITFMAMLLCQTVSGQTEDFEQECNVLQTLDTLGARLQKQEALLEEQKRHSEHQDTLLEEQKTRLQKQEAELATLRQQTSESARGRTSSTYVRWGRTTCPGNGSELVYSGYVGGSHYSHSGAAVDYLCLPTDPHFANYEVGVQDGAFIYGAEYEIPFHQKNEMTFFPDNDRDVSLGDKDVPCAVCKTTRSTVLMVPARKTCHDGWTLEYSGYLSANHYNHSAASQYVCLDGKPEYLDGGRSNDNGKLFYLVEARCGSLRCPPYEEGRELTCAVCSI